jgi:hypothetical protein
MVHSLSQLNLSDPQVRGVSLFTVITLKIGDNKLDHEALLKESAIEDLLLDSKFDLDTTGVGLGPYETRIHEFHSLEAFDLLETESQQLSRFEGGVGPGGSQVAVALTAVLQLEGLRDALGNVNLRFQAVNASVGLVGDHQNTTNAAATKDGVSSDEMITFYWQRKGMGLGHFCSWKQLKRSLLHGLKHSHYPPPYACLLPQVLACKSAAQKEHYWGSVAEAMR